MKRLVIAELRARRRMVIALALGAATYLLILGLSYHAIGVEALGQTFGRSRAIGAFSGSRSGDVLSPHGWMGLGFNHPMLMITSLTPAIAIGAGSIAGEVETGRAQLLLSAPVARSRYLATIVVVWALAELVVLVSALVGALAGGFLSADLRAGGLGGTVWAPVQFAPLTALVAAVAFMASAHAATRGRALGLSVGITVFAYLTSVVSGMVDGLDWLRWCTPFGYYDPGAAINHGPRLWPMLALLAAAALLIAAAARTLERRDLA